MVNTQTSLNVWHESQIINSIDILYLLTILFYFISTANGDGHHVCNTLHSICANEMTHYFNENG